MKNEKEFHCEISDIKDRLQPSWVTKIVYSIIIWLAIFIIANLKTYERISKQIDHIEALLVNDSIQQSKILIHAK